MNLYVDNITDPKFQLKLRLGNEVTVPYGEDTVEIWRLVRHPDFVVSDYPLSVQFVSNKGRLMRNNGEVFIGNLDTKGYLRVSMGYIVRFAHSIVCWTFIGPPPTSDYTFTVDHIDGNRENNDITNLKWADNYEQLSNRGVKRFDRLEPGEMRVLMNPPKKEIKLLRKEVPKTEAIGLTRYKLLVNTDISIQELLTKDCIKEGTLKNNIAQHFQIQDGDVFIRKLGLTANDIVRSFEVMVKCQEIKQNTTTQTSDYTHSIVSALGPCCVSSTVAIGILRKLHAHVCKQNQQ